jgi:hypothetical protein
VNARFTIDGSDALESRLAGVCREVSGAVRGVVPASALEALVLGGGYGRGQGGVLKAAAEDRPYNDLEFYVFIRGNVFLNERRYRGVLEKLGKSLSHDAGLHIEFKIYSAKKLRRSRISMFTYDLATGHRIIFGNEGIFEGCEHHLAAGEIPPHEATRLLFNRCSGLLLAGEHLRHPSLTIEEADFIGRNLAKAQLAFGDAVLTIFGQYHWNCLKRHARLDQLAVSESPSWISAVRQLHARGVEFKLHPPPATLPIEELQKQHIVITSLGLQLWLWAEGRRLNRPFSCARDYALDVFSKCPETAPWRNCLINLKTFGVSALWDGWIFCYPRQRLFDALCLLLWDEKAVNESTLMQRLQNNLRARTSHWQDLILAYKNIWQSYG